MIAKVAWFEKRKYTGWGLSPKSWQGYVYIMLIAAVVGFIQAFPFSDIVKMILSVGWVVFVLIDILQVMTSFKLDEREQKMEAIAERNASWTMVAATVLAIFYTMSFGKELKGQEFMPVLIFPIIAGVIAKGISNFVLDKRGI